MIGQSKWFGHSMLIFRSDTPYGPFTDQKVLFAIPETIDKIGDQYYKNLYMVNCILICREWVNLFSQLTRILMIFWITLTIRVVRISIVHSSSVFSIGRMYMMKNSGF